MAKPRFTPNRGEIAAFLKSQAVQDMVGEAGRSVAERAGPGFSVQVNVGTRARSTVAAETAEARERQARDHVLERVVGGSS